MSNAPNTRPGDTLLFRGAHLTITLPDGSQQTHTLTQDIVRIGRGDNDNDIALPDDNKSISRKHLEIHHIGAGYQVIDLGSMNGIYVNGIRIETDVRLEDENEIRIGDETAGEKVLITFHMGTPVPFTGFDSTEEVAAASMDGEFQTQPPVECPYLEIHWSDSTASFFPIRKKVFLLGRDPQCDLVFPAKLRFVSNQHAEIQQTDAGFTIVDLNSTNGTRLNNQLIQPGTPTPLHDDSIIRIGDESFGSSIGLTFHDHAVKQPPVSGYSPLRPDATVIGKLSTTTIGRNEVCDIVLQSPQVSRTHARILQADETCWIEDLKSTNGTFVNNQLITRKEIKGGDVITIGNHILVFQDGQLSQYQSHGMRVDVSDLTKDVKTRRGPLRILQNVNMTILPREFIAIVGGSGAGKSTLMNALIGYRPADGNVELNGHDFYKEYAHFRSQLGYVPQSSILHSSLTVEKALDYTARLRFPSDINAEERSKRIAEVLETVSMNTDTIRKTRISNLSGGQRKRVSIAAELLADPKLIFLDEATSGLDPGLEKKMMHTLRRMADEGRTVILITHATANIVQTDHVAFISQGRLIYFGPSQEALDFFDIDDFADIYERIEQHGYEWEQIFHIGKPKYHQAYVLDRKVSKPPASERDLPKIRFGIGGFIRQLSVLTQRAISVLMSDWFTLVLMLLLFPLTAILQLVISTKDILVGVPYILADPIAAAKTLTDSYLPFADLNTFVFVMGLEAALVGMYVPSNELIKERTVYLRERMVNLKVFPYLLSKVSVFTMFAAIQTFLYLLVLSVGVDLPDQGLYFPGPIELFITLFLTMLASMGIGFIVSAISQSSDMAIYILVILLFFQFFFAGTVFDMRDNIAEPLSYLTTTRWSLTALGVTINMEDQVDATIICTTQPDDPRTPIDESEKPMCLNYPDAATENLMLSYDDEKLLQSWGILIVMAFITIMVTGFLIKRLDN
ncbi:MAG: FHA domain-containing protein [Anaerolineaceae bacterium]|nr:FHA domain-containing protein [Anaerolineaceae bacterium]